MNKDLIKGRIRQIEKCYDYNHATEHYDVLCDLDELADLIIQLNKEAIAKANRKPCKPSKIEWDISDRLMGYDEEQILARANLAVFKYLYSHDLSDDYREILGDVAQNTVHEWYQKEAEGKDPRFKVTLDASSVEKLLEKVEDVLQEKCEELIRREQEEANASLEAWELD
jgi:16S rRNA C967 or C1407 C5-methylase (RsmB/RsmF family)